jgi:hypothetical protein
MLSDEQLDEISDEEFKNRIGITKYEYRCLVFLKGLQEVWGSENITMFISSNGE